jgi:hypothetical protein
LSNCADENALESLSGLLNQPLADTWAKRKRLAWKHGAANNVDGYHRERLDRPPGRRDLTRAAFSPYWRSRGAPETGLAAPFRTGGTDRNAIKKLALLLAGPLALLGATVPATGASAQAGAAVCAVAGTVNLSSGVHLNPAGPSNGFYNFVAVQFACAGTMAGLYDANRYAPTASSDVARRGERSAAPHR